MVSVPDGVPSPPSWPWPTGITATRRTLKPPPDKTDIPSDTLLDAAIAALGGATRPPMGDAELSARAVQFARLLEQAAATSADKLTDILDQAETADSAAASGADKAAVRAASITSALEEGAKVASPRRRRSAVL